MINEKLLIHKLTIGPSVTRMREFFLRHQFALINLDENQKDHLFMTKSPRKLFWRKILDFLGFQNVLIVRELFSGPQ